MKSITTVGTLPQLLSARVSATPNQVSVRCADDSGVLQDLTWRDFHDQVVRVSTGLRRLGLVPGDRLAVQLPTCVEWEIVNQAGLMLGAVLVGIEPREPAEHWNDLLTDCEARMVIVADPQVWDHFSTTVRDRIAACICVGGAPATCEGSPLVTWDCLLTRDSDSAITHADLSSPTAPATIVYTSGTTGKIKGIVFSHEQLLLACTSICEAFPEIEPGDSTICWLPMSHLFQRMMNLVSIARGVTMIFLQHPETALDALAQIKPSFFIAVPRLLEKLATEFRAGPNAPVDWVKGIKFAITGSAPTPLWVLETLRDQGLLVVEAYGLTENCVPMAANHVTDYRFGSVGRPFPGNDIRFADDGEILVRGRGLFAGYYQDMDRASCFSPDGYYRSGDLGYLDADGFLYLTGRKSELIKTSTGRRVSPTRVEAAYAGCPLFHQIVVVGNGRKQLAALVALNHTAVNDGLARRGLPPAEATDLQCSEAVKTLVAEGFAGLGTELSPHERVSLFAILPSPLTVAAAELTTTLKLRRARIEENHAALINEVYGQPGPADTASTTGADADSEASDSVRSPSQ